MLTTVWSSMAINISFKKMVDGHLIKFQTWVSLWIFTSSKQW